MVSIQRHVRINSKDQTALCHNIRTKKTAWIDPLHLPQITDFQPIVNAQTNNPYQEVSLMDNHNQV